MKAHILTIFMYLLALAWAGFGAAWLAFGSVYRLLYGLAGLACSVMLFGLAYFLGKRKYWAWRLASVLVGIVIVAAFFDQVGWADLAYLALAVMVFVLLLLARPAFAKP